MQVNLIIPGVLSHLIYSKFIMELSPLELCFIILVIFTLFVLFKYMKIHKNNRVLSDKLKEIEALSATKEKKIASILERGEKNFRSSMDSVGLTTKLQKPRIKAMQAGSSATDSFHAPEKYSYIRSLAARGLSPDEIASILSLSTHEAHQLVALSMIGSRKS